MGVDDGGRGGDDWIKRRALFNFRIPFWQSRNASSSASQFSSPSSSSANHHQHHYYNHNNQSERHHLEDERVKGQSSNSSTSVSSVMKSLLPTRRRLRLDPAKKLYFPYEPGKQVRSAVRIKNTSRSYVAFKFQTTAPKSCFMRPPGGILAPGESIIATVFKFVEPPEGTEKPFDQKSKVKFKIMSLKVKAGTEYVPELFDEQKDQVAVEQILHVVFMDVDHPSPAMEKLHHLLAEAEAALEARKKPPEDPGPRVVGEGLVIDEWKERRERYLAKQQAVGADSS